jgi:transcription initiation factor TFIIB
LGLSTTFRPSDAGGKNSEKTNEMYRLKKWNKVSSTTSEKNLSWAMGELDKLCSKLNLSRSVQEEAAILYRKALKQGLVMGRKTSSMTAASLLTICRMKQIPRTLDEISYHSHIDRWEIAQYYRMLLREMGLRVPVPKAKYKVSKIASGAGLSEKTQRKAIEILREAERLKLTGGKSRLGMAGAALYIAGKMNGETRTKKLIAESSGVTEVTIRAHYRILKKALN